MTLTPWFRRLGLLSLAAVALSYLLTCQLGDRIWWALPFLFGPRWLLAMPLVGVVPWLLVRPREAWLPVCVGAALTCFGLLDVRIGTGRLTAGAGVPVRVVELNAGAGSGGNTPAANVVAELQRLSPDVAVFAECGNGPVRAALSALPGYHFKVSETSLCLLSRGEILEWSERDPMDIWKEGGSGAIVRAKVQTAAGPLRVGLVHLETPRDALDNYADLSTIPTLGDVTRANIRQREEESTKAREWILPTSDQPTIVVGDFNLPIESAIFRRHWSDLRDAFSRGGLGSGHTKRTRWWGVRIDHILTTSEIGTSRSFTGRDVGSDHLPLVADLIIPAH
ncbi:MAG: endonuclease/exonuclease/phosphatase family protein [Gemmatimonadota bacterium]